MNGKLERESCYGCKHLRSKTGSFSPTHGDGSIEYSCANVPGLVLATVTAFDRDKPTPIKDDCYERIAP